MVSERILRDKAAKFDERAGAIGIVEPRGVTGKAQQGATAPAALSLKKVGIAPLLIGTHPRFSPRGIPEAPFVCLQGIADLIGAQWKIGHPFARGSIVNGLLKTGRAISFSIIPHSGVMGNHEVSILTARIIQGGCRWFREK
jgi:hypothetical protein